MNHVTTIVAIICITIITGICLMAGEDIAIVITALSIIGGLGGYLARRNANKK